MTEQLDGWSLIVGIMIGAFFAFAIGRERYRNSVATPDQVRRTLHQVQIVQQQNAALLHLNEGLIERFNDLRKIAQEQDALLKGAGIVHLHKSGPKGAA